MEAVPFLFLRAWESFVATYVYKQVVPSTGTATTKATGGGTETGTAFLINRCKFLIIVSSLEKYNSFKQ